MKSVARCLVVASVSMLVALLHAAAPAQPSISPAGRSLLSQYLAGAVERGDVPGVAALVVDRAGVLYEGAFGRLDVARHVNMPPNALFRIASMTKPVTSVAVMMLLEAGKLGLDDPVSKYLPAFENPRVISRFNAADGTYETRAAKQPITIRHLMTHTSGIGYGFSSPIVLRLLQGTQKSETDLPLLHDPGDRWTYGASTRVLGQVIEKISGEPVDVFLRDRIFDPLKMSDTSFAVSPEKLARVVTVHRRVDDKLVEEPNAPTQQAPVRGDGGLYSTARDYGTFLQMLLKGGSLGNAKLLSAKSVRMMGENQIGPIVVEEQPAADPARTRPFPLGAGRDKFGLGFQIAARDERYAKLRSPGSLSWAGIDNTHFWIDPNRHIAGVMLMQVLPFYDDACIRVLRGFEALVYRHLG
jgi:CubicO group peptidase (beta-lactamase class C family)